MNQNERHLKAAAVIALVALQAAYVSSRGLGGVHIWTLDMDDFGGSFCSEGPYPLIHQLRTSMGKQNISGSSHSRSRVTSQ